MLPSRMILVRACFVAAYPALCELRADFWNHAVLPSEAASSTPGRLGTACNGINLQGSGILGLPTLFHHFRPLSRDPFANIRRAVSEYSSVELSLSKEFHSLSVDQIDVLKIDRNRTRLGLYFIANCVHILFCNPAANAQHHVVAADNSVDSAAHVETSDEALAVLIICVFPTRLLRLRGVHCCKPSTLLKSLKIFAYSR